VEMKNAVLNARCTFFLLCEGVLGLGEKTAALYLHSDKNIPYGKKVYSSNIEFMFAKHGGNFHTQHKNTFINIHLGVGSKQNYV